MVLKHECSGGDLEGNVICGGQDGNVVECLHGVRVCLYISVVSDGACSRIVLFKLT